METERKDHCCSRTLAFAAGAGLKVVLVQFLKSLPTSELKILEGLPNYTILRGKEGNAFSFSMTDEEREKTKRTHDENLKKALDLVNKECCDILILDEIIGACQRELVDKATEGLVLNKPENLSLSQTGRNPEEWMLNAADYISEIRKVQHPYDKGIPARIGIENRCVSQLELGFKNRRKANESKA